MAALLAASASAAAAASSLLPAAEVSDPVVGLRERSAAAAAAAAPLSLRENRFQAGGPAISAGQASPRGLGAGFSVEETRARVAWYAPGRGGWHREAFQGINL